MLCKLMKKTDRKAKMTDKKANTPTGDEAELSISIASDLEKHNPIKKTVHSTNSEGESSCGIISYTDKSDKLIDDSACYETNSDCTEGFLCIPTCSEEGEGSSHEAFDFENENLHQKTDNSNCHEAKTNHPMNFASEHHVADVTILKEVRKGYVLLAVFTKSTFVGGT